LLQWALLRVGFLRTQKLSAIAIIFYERNRLSGARRRIIVTG